MARDEPVDGTCHQARSPGIEQTNIKHDKLIRRKFICMLFSMFLQMVCLNLFAMIMMIA